MSDLRLSQDVEQFFVNGTMAGLTNYFKRRKQDAKSMIISRAGAWLKGNYIEDALAKQSKDFGISFKHKMAGYSWEYLEFNCPNLDPGITSKVIVKNMKTLSKVQGNKNYLPEYLSRDAAGNIEILRKNQDNIHNTHQEIRLELFPVKSSSDNIETSDRDSESRFYVVGYNLDQNQNVASLKLIMPNPENQSLVEVDDLTEYIIDAPIQPDFDDLSVVQYDKNIPESQYDDSTSVKYEVAENDAKKEN